MTAADEYPAGYLKVLAGVLAVMIANASFLTTRDLFGADLFQRPLTLSAVCLIWAGVGCTLGVFVARHWVTGFRILALALLAGDVCGALAPDDIGLARGVPWSYHFCFVGLLAAVVCLRPAWLAAYGAVTLTVEGVEAAWRPGAVSLLLAAAVTAVAAALLLGRIVALLRSTQKANQRAADATLEQATALAADAARELWDGWVHDHVLVALRLGSQRELTAAAQARDVLASGLSRPGTESSDLRAVAQKVANEHRIWLRWSVLQSSSPPERVSAALHGALGEAIRNAARHSGASSVVLSGTISASAVDLTVADFGCGFASSTSSAGLGIPTSIVGQLSSVGGNAEVTSAPGQGTTVALTWRPEPLVEPTFDVPLQGAVAAAATIAVLAACRTAIELGPGHVAWIATGLATVLALTGIMVDVPRLTSAALVGWVAAVAILSASAPMTGEPEQTNWFAMGSAAIFIAAALNRKEKVGLVCAVATVVSQLLVAILFRHDQLASEWGYWAQPVVYAGLAWLGLVLLARLQRRHADAVARATAAEQGLILRRAEQEESRRRVSGLPDELFPVLEELATGEAISADLAQRCALTEAATRDCLTAPGVVTPELSALLTGVRKQGAYVSVNDGGAPAPAEEVDAVRRVVVALAPLAGRDSRLTIRWTVSDPVRFATVTLTEPRQPIDTVALDLPGAETVRDPHAFQVRLARAGSLRADSSFRS